MSVTLDKEGVKQCQLPTGLHGQYPAPRGFLRWAGLRKSRLFVGRDGACVFRVGISRDHRGALLKQGPHAGRDKCRAMAFPHHVGLADVLVDAPRPLWKPEKMVIIPPMDSVVLHVGKGASCRRDNPSAYPRVFRFLLTERLSRIPPLAYMRSRLPLHQQIKISWSHPSKSVSVGH